MKNKVISAMLLGMSATMAVPGTVVMAAEDGSESTAVEETAAEVPEAEGGESEAEQNDEESQDKQDTDTAVQKMIDYATDESAKVADTPDDFGPKLSNIVFSDDVFGRYADSLNEYINGSEVDTGSIYNCEMDMVDKVAELTKDESAEAIAASKYQVALTFESVYGEDAFMPGRDIRRALIADSSKDEDFAVCGTIAEADTVYISAGGTTAIPATLFKAVSEQPENPDETGATDSPNDTDSVTKDEDQNGADDSTTEETPSDTTNPDTPGDVTTDSDSTEEEKRSLDEYVEGLDDIEIQLGDDLPSPRVSYDDTKVVSVSLDTSKVDKNTIGVYTISYIIKGVDGTTSIPYMGVYENGIIQVDENSYSKAYVIPDMNFLIEDTEKQKETFGNFMELLGSFGPEVHIQQVIFNKTIKHAELERKVLIPMKNDRLNEYREEMNEMLIDKMSKARNNIIHEKYFIATVEADDITSAKNTFSRLDDEIERGFQRVAGEKANAAPLTLVERLSTLYDIYNMDSNVPFYRRTKMKSDKVMESFNMRHIQKMGLTSKDVIGPTALTFERDYMIIGETYARAMMITDLPTFLRGDVLTELSNMPCNMLMSVHYRALPQSKSITLLKNKLVDVNANVVTLQKKASRNGYSVDVISPEIKQASQEVESLMGDLTQDNQKLFYTTVSAVLFGKDKDELDESTKLFQATAERFICQAKTLATQQEAGLNSCLPLGVNKLKVERLLNTRAAAIFLPFAVKELWQDDGMYYGLNGVSRQMILYNRTSAVNGNGS